MTVKLCLWIWAVQSKPRTHRSKNKVLKAHKVAIHKVDRLHTLCRWSDFIYWIIWLFIWYWFLRILKSNALVMSSGIAVSKVIPLQLNWKRIFVKNHVYCLNSYANSARQAPMFLHFRYKNLHLFQSTVLCWGQELCPLYLLRILFLFFGIATTTVPDLPWGPSMPCSLLQVQKSDKLSPIWPLQMPLKDTLSDSSNQPPSTHSCLLLFHVTQVQEARLAERATPWQESRSIKAQWKGGEPLLLQKEVCGPVEVRSKAIPL